MVFQNPSEKGGFSPNLSIDIAFFWIVNYNGIIKRKKVSPMVSILVLVVCVALLVLDWFIAKWFYEVAQAKGYYDKKYFWICFWLCSIGYLLVIALPDRGNTLQAASDELPEL